MLVNPQERLATDARPDDLNLFTGLQVLPGLLFNRLRRFHCRRLPFCGWGFRWFASHINSTLATAVQKYIQYWPEGLENLRASTTGMKISEWERAVFAAAGIRFLGVLVTPNYFHATICSRPGNVLDIR